MPAVRHSLLRRAETRSLGLGDVVGVLWLVLRVTAGVELVTATVLALRLRYAYGEAWTEAVWNGVFLAVSASAWPSPGPWSKRMAAACGWKPCPGSAAGSG